ncbi:MAG: GNAT family protein [Phycisphaerales bacterium]
MTPRPRKLTPDDADAYLRLRHEMLLDSPWAFLSSPGDDVAEDRVEFGKKLREPENAILAIDGEDGSLLAVAGVYRVSRLKMRHWASIWGVYTTPSARRRGFSRAVTSGAIETARSWGGVEMINIAVSANSPGAQCLYESLGFVAWGREPNVTRVGDRTYDEIHLAMRLDEGAA